MASLPRVWRTCGRTHPAADKAATLRMALAIEAVQTALFHTWAALFIGLPFVLLGLSGLLDGGGFPRWLGPIALTGGTGALCSGVAGFLREPVPSPLFTISAFLVTLWVVGAGVLVWRTELMVPR